MNYGFFQVRRVRVRPGFAALYPEIAPGVWIGAKRAAHLVQHATAAKPSQPPWAVVRACCATSTSSSVGASTDAKVMHRSAPGGSWQRLSKIPLA